MVSYQCV